MKSLNGIVGLSTFTFFQMITWMAEQPDDRYARAECFSVAY